MTILYAGDWHARIDDASKAIQSAEAKGATALVQVGDFGFGFPEDDWLDYLEKRARQAKWKVPIYTCGGNHDSWPAFYLLEKEQGYPDKVELVAESGVYWIPRGNFLEIEGISHLFIGGAESTDRYNRIEDKTWWKEEQPSAIESQKFFDNFELYKPDTIVSHDAPLRVPHKRRNRNQSFTPNMLENVLKLSKHQPRRWYYGHFHELIKQKIEKTNFYCCGYHGEHWVRDEQSIEP